MCARRFPAKSSPLNRPSQFVVESILGLTSPEQHLVCNDMKSQYARLADVRKALSGKEITKAQATQLLGGWGATKPYIRNPYPFVVDTDKP
jgi:hypothetical protein